MTIAHWCLLAAGVLPLLSVLPGKFGGGFDNARPRDPAFWKDGFRARARAAEMNGFEAFPLFAVAVFVGLSQGGDPDWIDRLALLFVTLRVIYVISYWTDRPNPRSLAWGAGFLTVLAIFTSSLWS